VPEQVPTAAPTAPPEQRLKPDSGFPIAIPDVPAVDAGDDDPPSTPSMTSAQEQPLWGAPTGESEKLVEARAKMIEMLGSENASVPPEWGASDIPPAKPSSLDWGEAPQVPFGGAAAKPESKPPAPAPPPLPPKKPAPPPRR
jgi:hypothetical protein